MSEAHSISLLPENSFRWYLTGLTDGEGCFALNFIDWKGDTVDRRTWRLCFVISLRADDDSGLIAIKQRMGCGVINYATAKRGGKSQPLIRWVVTDVGQITNIIVPHFEQFPLGLKKGRDFNIWKQAVPVRLAIKRRSKGHPWGRYRKGDKLITPAEHQFFAALSAQLKSTREYKSDLDQSALPCRKPDKTLFDDLEN